MKAVLCNEYGPPEKLALTDLPDPEPQSGEAVIRVEAAALNFMDTLIIEGKYQVKPDMPFSPGAEFAGVVEAVAADVTAVKPGDRVMAFPGHGCVREKIVLPAASLVAIPDAVPAEAAAGLLVAFGTTLHALKDRARLEPNETLAVLGASGGVGIAAVEIGRLMGAHVIACASSDDKLEFAREKGAATLINYRDRDLRAALKEIGGRRGIDIVYDPVGGDLAEPALRSLAWRGRHLVIGFASGEIPKPPLNLALLKGCDILGVFWGRFTEEEPERHLDNTRQLLDWVAAGDLEMPIHGVYGIDRTAEALGILARREARGKVIIRP